MRRGSGPGSPGARRWSAVRRCVQRQWPPVAEVLAAAAHHQLALTRLELGLVVLKGPSPIGLGIDGNLRLIQLHDHVLLIAGHSAFRASAIGQDEKELGRLFHRDTFRHEWSGGHPDKDTPPQTQVNHSREGSRSTQQGKLRLLYGSGLRLRWVCVVTDRYLS